MPQPPIKKAKLVKSENLSTKNANTVDSGMEGTMLETTWETYEILGEHCNLDQNIAKNIIDLFESGNTVPFIARYRKNETQCMSPDQLREIKKSYDDLCTLKLKMENVSQTLMKMGVLDNDLKRKISNTTTMEELEYIVSILIVFIYAYISCNALFTVLVCTIQTRKQTNLSRKSKRVGFGRTSSKNNEE